MIQISVGYESLLAGVDGRGSEYNGLPIVRLRARGHSATGLVSQFNLRETCSRPSIITVKAPSSESEKSAFFYVASRSVCSYRIQPF